MKFLGLLAVVVTALLAVASPAAARDQFTCNGVFTGATYDDVVVPRKGACTLLNATVRGNVKALDDAYFQSTGATIGGNVKADSAQTLFIDTGSKVSGTITSSRTSQVFIFNARVVGEIEVKRSSETVQICGTTVTKGDIEVERSGRDILIGDPLAIDCAGNVVKRGNVEINNNSTNVEFVIRGNTITKGELEVIGNTGPVPKVVENNVGGKLLRCSGNGGPLVVRANSGWDRKQGQCAKRSKKSKKAEGRR